MTSAALAIQPQPDSVYSVDKPESWVELDTVNLAELEGPREAPLHFLRLSYQNCIRNEQIHYFMRRVYQVNDESQIEDNSQSIHELSPDTEHLVFHRCSIQRSGKVINCLDENRIRSLTRDKDMERQMISDRVTVELLIDDLRVGDIVVIETTLSTYAGAHPLHGRYYHSCDWMNWGIPVDDLLVRTINQSTNPITLQRRADAHKVNKLMKLNPGKVHKLHKSNIEAQRPTEYLPYWYWDDVLIGTTTQTWPQISAHLFDENEKHGALKDDLDAELIADIGTIDWQNCSDATVLQLIRFVQDSVRYRAESNGIHTHTPKQINETLRRRTGDCKDKSALLVVLLKRLGVEARLTLVHDGIKDDLQKLQPSPYWFNHMVVQFDFEGKTYLVDPTLQKQGGTLATQCTPDFRLCLPLCKGGSELVEVEKIIPQESLVMIHEFDLRFDTMDQCTLKVTRKYMRERADYMRFYLASRSKAELAENYLQSAMGMFCREFTTANAFSIVEDDLTKNVLHTEEIYNLTGSNDDPENQAIAFTSDLHDDFKMPKRNTHPVTTGPACTCRHEVRVIYGFAQEKIEDHFEEKNQFFEYRDSVETDDNTIISKISFTGLREDVNADEVDECTAAIIKVNQRCGTTLPLRAKVEKETSLTDHLYYLVPLGLACAAAWWFLKG